jgi:shikimate dehydrogenase
MEINGETKLFALIGHPVEHSFSPSLHNLQLELNGINGRYLAFDVKPENLGKALEGLYVLGAVGVNVTVPYKEKVIPFLTKISREAELIGAVNTLIREENGFSGDNTDGRGFLESLKREKDFSAKGKRVIIIGAGGAARGVGISLALAGAREVSFINRTFSKAEDLRKIIEINTHAQSESWDYNNRRVPDKKIEEADLIINSTSIGMYPDLNHKPDINYDVIHKGQLVADLVYNPEETLFLKEAKTKGAEVINGKGMLYFQGELAFNLWTGKSFK